jgi:hypothetical protein
VLSPLSPEADTYFHQQDVDAFINEWQIPLIHLQAFNELKTKGYLVRRYEEVMSADGSNTGVRGGWGFADEILQAKDQEMRR